MIKTEYYINVAEIMKRITPKIRVLKGDGENLPIILLDTCEGNG